MVGIYLGFKEIKLPRVFQGGYALSHLAMCEDSTFFTTLLTLGIGNLLNHNHPNRCKVISWVLIHISLMTNDGILHCILAIGMISLIKYLIQCFAHLTVLFAFQLLS